jgi:hypothetical protein
MAGAPALGLASLVGWLVLAAAAPVDDAQMRGETERLLAALGAIRGIPPRGMLERKLVSQAEARAEIGGAVASAVGGPELAGRARLWERLGLLPAGADYSRLVAGRYSAAPAGFYDPVRRRLFVPAWIPLGEQRTALAHELGHALCDQRFGLRQLLQIGPDGRHGLDGDAERARLALLEGDATTAALELADPRGSFWGPRQLPALAEKLRAAAAPPGDASPPWLRATAAFVHGDGAFFVARVRARQTWRAIDALWADPPQSSEQVLHPEKYDVRDKPVAISSNPVPSLKVAWRAEGTDVLGELGVRTWLTASVPEVIASRAAAGWGGDRAVLYAPVPQPGGADGGAGNGGTAPQPFVVWLTVWDDVTDAEDFARTAPSALAHLAGAPDTPPLGDGGRAVIRGTGGIFALAWRGNIVALLLGAPASALPALDELIVPGRPPAARPRPRAGASRQTPPVRK